MDLYNSIQTRVSQIEDEINLANLGKPRLTPERSTDNLAGEAYGLI